MKNEIREVAAAVLERDGKYFICRRKNGGWEFPGGKAEPGETLFECIRRECREELDIEVMPIGELYSVPVPGREELRLHFLDCRLISGTPSASVHSALEWVERENLNNYELCPADRAFYDNYIKKESRE